MAAAGRFLSESEEAFSRAWHGELPLRIALDSREVVTMEQPLPVFVSSEASESLVPTIASL